MQEVARGEQLEVWGLALGHFDNDFWGSQGSNYEPFLSHALLPLWWWHMGCELWDCRLCVGCVFRAFPEITHENHQFPAIYILGVASLKDGVFVLFLFCMCLWCLHTVSLVLNNVHEWNSTIFVNSLCLILGLWTFPMRYRLVSELFKALLWDTDWFLNCPQPSMRHRVVSQLSTVSTVHSIPMRQNGFWTVHSPSMRHSLVSELPTAPFSTIVSTTEPAPYSVP